MKTEKTEMEVVREYAYKMLCINPLLDRNKLARDIKPYVNLSYNSIRTVIEKMYGEECEVHGSAAFGFALIGCNN